MCDAIWENPSDVTLGHFQEIRKIGPMSIFCQNYVFIKLLFYNILSIISENILVKLTCLVLKNLSYECAAEVLSLNTTKTVNLSK